MSSKGCGKRVLLLLLIAGTLCLLGGEALARRKGRRSPATPAADSGSAVRDALSRIWAAENLRNGKDAFLTSNIHHPASSVRQAAFYAIGRIGETSLLGELSDTLNRKRSEKADAIFALGLLPDDNAPTIAVQHLAMQKDPDVLSDLLMSIGRGGNEKHLAAVVGMIQNSANPKVIGSACYALGLLWAKDGSEDWQVPTSVFPLLLQRIRQSDDLASVCSFAFSRYKGKGEGIPAADVAKTVEALQNPEADVFLLRVLAKIPLPAATALLVQKAGTTNPLAVRIEAVKAFSAHPISPVIAAVLRGALESGLSSLVAQTLETIQSHGTACKELAPAILALYRKSASVWVQSRALRAGMVTDPPLWRPVVLKELEDSKSLRRNDAAAALALAPTSEDTEVLATLLLDPQPGMPLEILESMGGWPEEAFNESTKKSMRTLLERKDPATVAAIASIVEKLKWSDFGPWLSSAYSSLPKAEWVETRVATLNALNALKQNAFLPVFETALKDSERSVVVAAVEAIRALTDKDESSKIPLNSKPTAFAFSVAEVERAQRSHVVLKTQRGEIRMRFFKEAPLNTLNFVRLVKKGFYDGLSFHRTVPGFVAQGGDPKGDGYGGPGYLVRDEVSPRRPVRGTVGIATSGKDTGGSQFFINLGPNFHLDARYTFFAEVFQGMDVADRLEAGDKILSAKVVE